MKRFLPSIPSRNGLVLALTTVLTLVAAGVFLTVYDTQVYRAQAIKQTTVQAKILAASVAASLVFGDPDAAQEYVNALAANPDIAAAAVYNDQSARVASFARVPEEALPATLSSAPNAFASDYLSVAETVIQNGRTVGAVTIRSMTEPLSRRVFRYGGIVLLVTMAALVVTVLVTGRAALARTNAQLLATNAQLQREMAEREKVEEALRQAQKMEAIGQLTGGIAHDFNNMLAVVIGGLDLLKRKASQGEEVVVKYANAALEGAKRAAALTQRLLAFSRQQPLRPEAIDVNKLVGGLSELLHRTLGGAIRVQTVLGAGTWKTHADPHQLENALVNLAVNSRDAMGEGGRLTIETANSYLDQHYAAEAGATPGQYVMIAVTDTGTGMPPEVAAKAFDPFFTTKGVGKGTGLGLSQVYGFVRQSGGHIKIYSEVGHGTTVKIYLPRHAGEAAGVTPTETKAPAPPSAGVGVLLVEDEDAVRDFATAALRELGYRVWACDSGAAALKLLSQQPDVDVLFTDIVMPDMNGRVLAEAALRQRPDLKVLYTTGYTRNAVVHNGVLDAGVHLLTKPFTIDQLGAALSAVLSGSRVAREKAQ